MIFLTSIACNVLDVIINYLPKSPERMKVAFIPTASNPSDNKEGVNNDRSKLLQIGFELIDVDISSISNQDLRNSFEDIEIIFVSGGNTFYLLQESHKSGFSELLVDFLDRGKIYIGSSAGSVLLGTTIEPIKMMDDPQVAPKLASYDGLGVVDFVPLVHFGNAEYVDQYMKTLKNMYSSSPKFVLIRDDQFILVQGNYWKLL